MGKELLGGCQLTTFPFSRWTALVVASLAIGFLHAQVETGIIAGTVTDPSGAVVPAANVTFKSASTGLLVTTQSNEAGRFQSPPLKPGEYELNVAMTGFKSSVLNVRVEVNDRVSADIKLQVGEATERVTVEASAIQLES